MFGAGGASLTSEATFLASIHRSPKPHNVGIGDAVHDILNLVPHEPDIAELVVVHLAKNFDRFSALPKGQNGAWPVQEPSDPPA
jgi:hypothetical protein